MKTPNAKRPSGIFQRAASWALGPVFVPVRVEKTLVNGLNEGNAGVYFFFFAAGFFFFAGAFFFVAFFLAFEAVLRAGFFATFFFAGFFFAGFFFATGIVGLLWKLSLLPPTVVPSPQAPFLPPQPPTFIQARIIGRNFCSCQRENGILEIFF